MFDLKIEMESGNAAFATEQDARSEAVRILRNIADKIAREQSDGRIADVNGNTIGEWFLSFVADDDSEG